MDRKSVAYDGEVHINDGIYPLNWNSDISENHKLDSTPGTSGDDEEDIYPDFSVWKPNDADDITMRNFLQKGYVAPALVKHEDQSGRPLMSELISKSTEASSAIPGKVSKLSLMSQIFVDAMHKRRIFNGLKSNAPFKAPPRVTLTEQKKEVWIKRLSDSKVSLRILSRSIPHGLRNKNLLEQCLSHKVPIARALWLIKCVASNEQKQLRSKKFYSQSVNKWVIEWTEQITSFVETTIMNCTNGTIDKQTRRQRMSYTIELVTNMYTFDLLNRLSFLTWVVSFTSHNLSSASRFEDFKHLTLHSNIIKLFWFKILKFDYLIKELSITLLSILQKLKNLGKNTKFELIAQKLSLSFQTLLKYLFYYNSDIFILPSHWDTLKPWLKQCLDLNLPIVNDQFKLISYRNETLTIDEFDLSPHSVPSVSTAPSPALISNDTNKVEVTQPDYTAKLYPPKNRICWVFSKLNNFEKESFSSLSKVIFDESTEFDTNYILHQIFLWCTEKVRLQRTINERITLISSILQFKISQLISQGSPKYKQFRSELENTVGDFVYRMAELLNYRNEINHKGEFYDLNSFLYLINTFYSNKLFIISSYLRRLIASGVIYLANPDRTCYIHILILNSLLPSNDSNMKSIFKRLLDSTNMTAPTNTMEAYKQEKLLLIDKVFELDELSTSFEDLALYNNKYTDPMYLGECLEVERFVFSYFENKMMTQVQVILTYNKLVLLYQLFEKYPKNLCRYIVLVIDGLNSDTSSIVIMDNRALSFFMEIVLFNMNYLQISMYNSESNLWDYCCNILTSWISINRYDVNRAIASSNIPASKYAVWDYHFIITANTVPSFLTPEELVSLDLASYERLSNGAEFSHYATLALTKYRTYVRNDENIALNLMTKFLRSLQMWKEDDFNKLLNDYFNRFFKSTYQLEYETNLSLILQMLADGLLDFKKVFDIFGNKNNTNHDMLNNENHLYLLWDLFFNDHHSRGCTLDFQIQFLKGIYIETYPENYYKLLSEIIFSSFKNQNVLKEESNRVGGSVDVVNVNPGDNTITGFPELGTVSNLDPTPLDEPMRDFVKIRDSLLNQYVIDAFWSLSLKHKDLFITLFHIPLEKLDTLNFNSLMLFVFHKILNQSTDIEEVSEIDVLKVLNYCNLSISQWMFIHIIIGRHKTLLDDFNKNNEFLVLTERILSISYEDENLVSLEGELFVYLSDLYKCKFLSACEQIYLNSEHFPKVIVNGNNVTNVLSNIMSSCSKVSDTSLKFVVPTNDSDEIEKSDENPKFEMTDALVFSLNGKLENLVQICNQLEQDKKRLRIKKVNITEDLKLGIKMISRIVLLNRYFLVHLIMRRSVNLQKDVLILNLLKLFNHKIMMKDPKLKNLLYDVLMSLKVIISECITERFKRNQANGGFGTQANLSLVNKETPTSSTFLSPIDSPIGIQTEEDQKRKVKARVKNDYVIMPNILNIKPPSFNSNLKNLLDMFDLKDTIPEINDNNLYIVNEKWEDTISYDESLVRFNSKPFEQIEDSLQPHALNDTAIKLQLFKVSVKRENPP